MGMQGMCPCLQKWLVLWQHAQVNDQDCWFIHGPSDVASVMLLRQDCWFAHGSSDVASGLILRQDCWFIHGSSDVASGLTLRQDCWFIHGSSGVVSGLQWAAECHAFWSASHQMLVKSPTLFPEWFCVKQGRCSTCVLHHCTSVTEQISRTQDPYVIMAKLSDVPAITLRHSVPMGWQGQGGQGRRRLAMLIPKSLHCL
eukprot:1144853-Pelagomonas_calceolata.AAC.2